jgi:hypothetical protein
MQGLIGVWRSLVAHLHGVQGVEGSNPFTPTTKNVRGLLEVILGGFFLVVYANKKSRW